MKKKLTIAILTSLLFTNSAYAGHHDKAKETIIKSTKVTENIYMLEGEGGNIGVLKGNDRTILIDAEFGHLSEKIKKAVKNISDKPISFLLNTHFHFDHTDGNKNFAKDGVQLISHKNVHKRLKEGSYIKEFKKIIDPAKKESLPILTYESNINLYQNGEEVEMIHYPKAHTDGDTAVFFKNSNVIHTGDLYFSRIYPFVDVSNGGSVEGAINALESIIKRSNNDTKIIPGHGKLSNLKQLKKDLVMLKEMSALIEKAAKNNEDKNKLLSNPVVKKYHPTYGKGVFTTERFIEVMYDNYKLGK